MARTIPAELLAHLGGDLLSVALCVKVTRRDGQVFGFTSANSALRVLGVNYAPEASVTTSSLRATEDTGVDNLEAVGLIQSASVTVADIRAGTWNHAAVEMFLVNYEDLTQGRLVFFRGRVANIDYEDGQFTFELRGLGARLAQQVVQVTSPKCRVKELFDAQCFVGGANFDGGLTPGDFRHAATVDSVPGGGGGLVINFDTDDIADGALAEGKVTFDASTGGLNAGLAREIKAHTRVSATIAQVTLHEVFPYAVAAGDVAELEQGCDRRFETCRDKFLNGGNFRGEPLIPGFGKITRRGRR